MSSSSHIKQYYKTIKLYCFQVNVNIHIKGYARDVEVALSFHTVSRHGNVKIKGIDSFRNVFVTRVHSDNHRLLFVPWPLQKYHSVSGSVGEASKSFLAVE